MIKKSVVLVSGLLLVAALSGTAASRVSMYPNGFRDGVNIRGVPVLNTYAGNVFWVDSGNGSNGYNGKTPDRAFATIDYAVGRCTANNGDIILVAPGHTETITADSGIDVDVAGVSIIGLGQGESRPVITFSTATTADFKIAAKNVTLQNIVFKCNIASQDMMIEVTGDDAVIDGCEFREGSATGLTFVTIGVADNDADRCRITNCRFYEPTSGNGDAAISIAKDQAGVEIIGNYIYGDFDLAGIDIPAGGNTQVDCVIADNFIANLQASQHAIQVNGTGSSGYIARNLLVTDAITTTIDPGGLACTGNIWNVKGNSDTEGVDALTKGDTTTNLIGVNDSDNAAVTSSVVANEDGSILERLEQLQEAINKGTGTALNANRSLLDEIPGDPNYNRARYFTVTLDGTSATWNTVASHEIVTVTGDVRLRILAECTGDLTSGGAATIELGTANNTAEIIAQTTATDIDGTEIWRSNTPDVETTAYADAIRDYVVVGGTDVGYTIGTAALTGGTIVFHVWWEPLSSTGAASAGTGAAL